jgi:phi13 family phage major tail protein
MQFGAKGARFASFAKNYTPTPGKAPTYDAAVPFAPLVKVTESPSFNTVKAYGDDRVTGQMSEFKECPIAIEVNDLPNATAAAVMGAKLGEDQSLVWSSNDTIPYGGFVFHIHALLPDTNKKVWRSFFYPQVQAVIQGRDYSTKGDSIVLANEKLTLNAIAAMDDKWRYDSPDFDTEEEAIAWENTKLGVTA